MSRQNHNLEEDFSQNVTGASASKKISSREKSSVTSSLYNTGADDDSEGLSNDDVGYSLMEECLSTYDENDDKGDGGYATFAATAEDLVAGTPPSGENIFSINLPPSLHPAASAGMRHVSSCYFSIGSRLSELYSDRFEGGGRGGRCESGVDLLQLLGDRVRSGADGKLGVTGSWSSDKESSEEDGYEKKSGGYNVVENPLDDHDLAHMSATDILYHDVMMRVFTFLSLESLASFSETSLRANFECFYFLQLQLQGALLNSGLIDSKSAPTKVNQPPLLYDDALVSMVGSTAISRLASIDSSRSHKIVQEYLDSNSTLKTMPLSHSLAYLRHALIQLELRQGIV